MDSQQYFNLLNVLGSNGGLLTYNSIQWNSSTPGSLGSILNADGTTGPSTVNASQQLVAINLNFNATIATSDSPDQVNADNIVG